MGIRDGVAGTVAGALLCLATSALSTSVQAGWYRVTNYDGYLGAYPIHLSIQHYDHFGSGLNIRGSYYHHRYRHAIPLYGHLDESGSLWLCELHGDEAYTRVFVWGELSPSDTSDCPFQLQRDEHSLRGAWASDERSYDVTLDEVGRLDNTDSLSVTGTAEIPYWGQTPDHLVLGAYDGDEIIVKIVDKRTGEPIQMLWPQDDCTAFGFVMTPIYMNVENHTPDPNELTFNCSGRGIDEVSYYRLNRETGQFEYVPPELPRLAYGDFNDDGQADEAELMEYEDRVTLIIRLGGSPPQEAPWQELEFPVDADAHEAVCSLPVRLEYAEISCHVEGATLPGCRESSNAIGLSLSDSSCDAIHLYWNHDEDRMAWWRH